MEVLWQYIPDPEGARATLAGLLEDFPVLYTSIVMVLRWVLALLALVLVARCIRSLFGAREETERWCYLDLIDLGTHIPVRHLENVIGRSKNSDIVLNYPAVSRSHAVLVQEGDGWCVIDLGTKNGTDFWDEPLTPGERTPVTYGDELSFGGIRATLSPLTKEEERRSEHRVRPGREIKPAVTLYMLTLFQLCMAVALTFGLGDRFTWAVPLCFGALCAVSWIYFLGLRVFRRTGFEIDFLAFFLSTVGLAVTAVSEPAGVVKQFVAFCAGLVFFFLLCWCLRDLRFALKMRWPAAAAAAGLLALTIVAGKVVYGALNWIYIGGISVQPSEIAKVFFVYAGATTLDRLFARRNVTLYLVLTAVCAAMLAYMNDFGTALIFFVAFLVVAYLRSGSIATVGLISGVTGFGGLLVLKFKPYIAARFATWLHAWDFPHDGGYQQTRTMTAAASGGLFGVGAGNGWLVDIPAADTDLVFGVVCEEHGLLIALLCVVCVCAFAVFAARSVRTARSAFYSIAACAAGSMLVFQTALNVLGSVDLLPLTGVTFPFVSNGGSSLVSAFGLLAFIKAADTRQNASFATRLQRTVLRRFRGDAQ